jgi:hypothetical protein
MYKHISIKQTHRVLAPSSLYQISYLYMHNKLLGMKTNRLVAMRLLKSSIVLLMNKYGYNMHVFACQHFLYFTEIWKG